MVITFISRESMDQLGIVGNLSRGQLNRENVPHSRLRIWSRETGSAIVPSRVRTLILHTQAESDILISSVCNIIVFVLLVSH